ncbi:MAG: NADH-quinone oxidoreductase subunit L, partial [Aeoliella sp.]
MNLHTSLPLLLGLAWLLPLASFAFVWIGYTLPQLNGHRASYAAQRFGGTIASAACGASFVLSLIVLFLWLGQHPLGGEHHGAPPHYAGDYYSLASFGNLHLTIGYYIDTLTVTMFCMVTLIATCVHVYSWGYMHEELADVTDHEVATKSGHELHRPGRYHRFFQYLSLFTFSMLGVVLAGNLAMVFIFWELVGICSYFLIGFYIERQSASDAANKAFIVNRVGDFGMLIGLMALWSSFGTLHFDSLFTQLGEPASAGGGGPSYALLFVAGVGLFCGCIGKSAQFPLHTWLPDAMEGPTPVSALVHSATMVAAGVYLVGRCYPIFVPEALLVIAIVGAITLALAATIAITAVDIKRVLAYSTISQLGYMMLALGLGGWVAGLFHLITHAFFKSLLFLCSGSVIHAVHTNDMREMGGLRHKMPWTAYTMLVGCLAIIGAGFPAWGIGLSGFFSKDAIVEQAWSFAGANSSPLYGLLLWVPLVGAVITAFYMFRLWYLTFAGEPRSAARFEHAHESPLSMVAILVLLATFAVSVGWNFPFTKLSVSELLEQSRPASTQASMHGEWLPALTLPDEHASHVAEIAQPAGWAAFFAAVSGVLLATLIYLWRWMRAEEIRQSFTPLHRILWNKWWFDEVYDLALVKPTMWLS